MAISLLHNIASLVAQNQLQSTQTKLQNTLYQLSSGSRINSGADDAAGLAIANGLQANITALTQSSQNANSGVGSLQVADGALAQITTLLNRAVTLATESATGTVSTSQRQALDTEYQQINTEIASIGSSTNYNGSAVFTAAAQNVFLSDGVSNSTISTTTGALSNATLGLVAGSSTQTTPAIAATGQLNFGATAAAGDVVVVGGQTYTFRATAAGVLAAGDVYIGTTAAASATNLRDAVNATPGGGAGTNYFAAAGANTTTAALTGTTLTFTANTPGTAANGSTFTTTGAEVITPFSGGVAAITATVAVTNTLLSAAGANAGANAQATLTLINSAIASVAALRGSIGANINRLQAASNVESVQVQNLTAAEDQITAANIPEQVTNLSAYSILNQSGISALAQANSSEQSILKLLQ
jgi:flagellin